MLVAGDGKWKQISNIKNRRYYIPQKLNPLIDGLFFVSIRLKHIATLFVPPKICKKKISFSAETLMMIK
jgi:hypothetical protein